MTRDRALAAVIGACSLALFLPLARPLVSGRVFVYNDLAWFHLPMRFLYRQALAAGDSVLWTPAIFSGLYLHGEGQLGLFHPFHQLIYRAFSLQAAFNLELLASYPAAFAGMVWFLRRLRFALAPALFGAMLFAFSGFNLLHHHHLNMVAVVAHLPALLAAADWLLVETRPARRASAFAAVALILGSEFLIGFPQAVWWNTMALAAFVVYRCAEARRWRAALPCAAAFAIGVALGAIQLLPSADAAARSLRLTLSRDFALTYSLHPYNVFQLWSPYFFERGGYGRLDYPWFHELGIYSGAILTVAPIYVWIRRRVLPERRTLMAAATAFAALNFVLALGRFGGLDILLTYLPVLESLRAPVRYIVLVQFSLAVLAAIAIEDLLAIAERRAEPPEGRLPWLWVPAALSVATLVLLNAHVLPFGRDTFSTVAAAAPGVAFVVGVTLLVALAARRVRGAIVALAIVTAADLAFWGLRFIAQEKPRRIPALVQAIEPAPEEGPTYVAAPDGGPLRGDILVLKGYRLTTGYVALFPATHHPLDSTEWQLLAGTQWAVNQAGARTPVRGSAARVRLHDAAGHEMTGGARMIADRPGNLVIEIDAPQGGRLEMTERFDPGWTVTLDGRPAQPVVVQEDFLGCVVPAGTRRVEFRFEPRSFRHGAIGSAAGAVLLLGGVLVMRRRESGTAGE